MSKKLIIVSGTGSETKDTTITPTDWTKCVICQMPENDQPIRCPAKSTRSGVSGYETFATNLKEFESLGPIHVPMNVDSRRLDDGEGIQETLEQHNAWWHKLCYNRFDSFHLARAQKWLSHDDTEECSPVKT